VHRRDTYGNTLLHLAILARFPKPALIQRIWEMNPDALFEPDVHGNTPFDYAVRFVHEWAIEYFQWKLSIWSVEEVLVKVLQCSYTMENVKTLQQREKRFREVVQGECERPLLMSLPRDCVRLISDYSFISDNILGGLEARSYKRAKVE